jgi:hypothetical protein
MEAAGSLVVEASLAVMLRVTLPEHGAALG